MSVKLISIHQTNYIRIQVSNFSCYDYIIYPILNPQYNIPTLKISPSGVHCNASQCILFANDWSTNQHIYGQTSFIAVNIWTPRCSYLFNFIWLCTHIAKLILFCQKYLGGVVLKKHIRIISASKSLVDGYSYNNYHMILKKKIKDLLHDAQVICLVRRSVLSRQWLI